MDSLMEVGYGGCKISFLFNGRWEAGTEPDGVERKAQCPTGLDALILLNCDESEGKKQSDEIIGGFLKVGKLRVHRVRKRFFENGMSGVFNLPHGGGRSKQIDGDFEAHLIALSCGEPPEGHSQWSLRLLADKMVELEYVESVSHETVRQALKKTNSSPGKKSNG